MYSKSTLLAFVFAGIASAQIGIVSVGVKGGVQLTEPNTAGLREESKRYLLGPSVEFRLPGRFAIEVSAMHQRLGSSTVFSYMPDADTRLGIVNRQRVNAWQFPVLGKYYFQPRGEYKLQPFIGTGYSVRTGWGRDEGTTTTTPASGIASSTTFNNEYRLNTSVGAIAAAGARWSVGRIAITPELRYQYWGSGQNFQRRHEANFLLGISF